MTFTHASMTFPPHSTEDLCSDNAVTDIRLRTKALDTWGITTKDTDIVKHSSLFKKINIEFQFRMSLGNLHTSIGHLSAMY